MLRMKRNFNSSIVPGDVDNPRVTEAMRTIVDECLTHNVVVGTFVDTIQGARKWRGAGVKYLCYSVDVGLFSEKCRETTRSLREEEGSA